MHQCNLMCAGRLPATRIQPRRGAAAIFWSRFPDGAPDPRMWHAACPVYKGAKWTLQKFKEIPRLHGEWALDNWSAEDGSPRQPRWEEAPQKPNSIMP